MEKGQKGGEPFQICFVFVFFLPFQIADACSFDLRDDRKQNKESNGCRPISPAVIKPASASPSVGKGLHTTGRPRAPPPPPHSEPPFPKRGWGAVPVAPTSPTSSLHSPPRSPNRSRHRRAATALFTRPPPPLRLPDSSSLQLARVDEWSSQLPSHRHPALPSLPLPPFKDRGFNGFSAAAPARLAGLHRRPHPLLLPRVGGVRNHVHVHEPVRRHGVAGPAVGVGDAAAGDDGVRAGAGAVAVAVRAAGVVGPLLGPLRLHLRRLRQGLLRHGRLRVRRGRVQRRGRVAARHARRVHARRRRRQGLLRRQPRRRLQPAHARAARRGGLPRHGVPRRPQRALPAGAPRRRRPRLPQRVRGVREPRVLLQRRLRQPQHLPPLTVLAALQVRLPKVLQLRLRRRHLHLHLQPHRLHHHFLPQIDAHK